MIPGAYNERVEMVLFARPTARDWEALRRTLFTPTSAVDRRKAMRQHAKPLRDRGWDWKKITDAWNEKTGETLTRNAAMTLYRHGRRRRKGRG